MIIGNVAHYNISFSADFGIIKVVPRRHWNPQRRDIVSLAKTEIASGILTWRISHHDNNARDLINVAGLVSSSASWRGLVNLG